MEGGHEEGITDILVVSLKLYIDIDINKRLRNVCACVCVCVLWSQHGRWFCVEGVLGEQQLLSLRLFPFFSPSPPPTHTNTHINTYSAPEKYTRIT